MEEQVLNWYVLYVMGGRENAIANYLNKSKELNVFCPQVEVVYRKQGRSQIVKRPMFPSYLFVKSLFTMSEFQNYLKQKRKEKSGIVKELHYEKGIPSLTEKEIQWMVHLMDEEDTVRKSVGIMEGDIVIIESGPLKGYESYIVHINRHKRKATLSFQMLGKEVRLDTALEIVKKIG